MLSWYLSPLAHKSKHVVLGVSSFASRVFQIYSKSALCHFRQAVYMYLVESQLKLLQSYNRPSRGRSESSKGTLPTPLRPLFGRRKHQKHLNRQGRLYITDSFTRFV